MADDIREFEAIIPHAYNRVMDVALLLSALTHCRLSWEDDSGTHFRVYDASEREEYYLRDREGYQIDFALHGYLESLLSAPSNEIITALVERNMICLIEHSRWCSSDSFESSEEEPLDPVAMAEQIPTLILQEVLARRLEGA